MIKLALFVNNFLLYCGNSGDIWSCKGDYCSE